MTKQDELDIEIQRFTDLMTDISTVAIKSIELLNRNLKELAEELK